jgi:hypothetical protein
VVIQPEAYAATITFDPGAPSAFYPGGNYVQGDYQFVVTGPSGTVYVGEDLCSPDCPRNGTNVMMPLSGTVTLSRVDNAPFTFSSFAAGEAHFGFPQLWATAVQVSGSSAAPVQLRLDLIHDAAGPLADFQTFLLPSSFMNQTYVTFTGIPAVAGGYAYYDMDNLVVEAASLPEAGTLLLLCTGGAAMMARRRRSRVQR